MSRTSRLWLFNRFGFGNTRVSSQISAAVDQTVECVNLIPRWNTVNNSPRIKGGPHYSRSVLQFRVQRHLYLTKSWPTPVGRNVFWIIAIVPRTTDGLKSLTCGKGFSFKCEMRRTFNHKENKTADTRIRLQKAAVLTLWSDEFSVIIYLLS